MKLQDKNIVITGAANGIGLALAKRFLRESPYSISLIDINISINKVASELGVKGYVADVTNENQFQYCHVSALYAFAFAGRCRW